MSEPIVVPIPNSEDVFYLQVAYDRMLPEIQKVEDKDLVPMNIDPYAACTTIKGSLNRIRAQRDEIQANIRVFNFDQFDKLEDYTWAMLYANSLHDMASKPAELLPDLINSATELRNRLYGDAVALANRNLIDGAKLKALPGTVGYRNLGIDLLDLSNLLRASWSTIDGKTPIQMSELVQAHDYARRIISAVADREQSSVLVAETQKIRHRAFTLLVNAYDQARKAITYTHWDRDDADEIAPSLYASRQASRRKGHVDPEQPEPAPKATPTAQPETSAHAEPATNPIPVGLPGSSPFVHS
jgi:hypothetical protein